MLAPWKKSYDETRQCIKKQRHHLADKGPYSQSYGFSSSPVQMRELEHQEGWAPKNWCFWTVVLEKTLESSLDSKGIQLVHPKGRVSEVAQLYLTLCDPVDCSLPGSSVHGIFQARVLGWVAISFSRGSSWPRARTRVSNIAGRFWATREALTLKEIDAECSLEGLMLKLKLQYCGHLIQRAD